MVRKLCDLKQVICDTTHDLTDLCIGIIGVSKPLQMIKRILSHIRLDIHTHDVAHVRHEILRRRIDQA